MKPRAIHQFHYGAAYGDGVTNAMFFTQRLLREAGYDSEIFCAVVNRALADRLRSFDALEDRDDIVLLVHYSLGHDRHSWIESVKCTKFLVYHNITPAEFLPAGSELQYYATLGRQQLAAWSNSGVFAGAIADSPFNADELKLLGYPSVASIPMLVDLDWIRSHPWNQAIQKRFEGRRNVLFVGRQLASKAQVELVRVMASLRARCDQPVRLILAGSHTSQDYTSELHQEINFHGLEDEVTVLDHIVNDDLFALYRIADIYISLSHHEGFGMPLVEAMNFNVPVLAFATTGIPSTLGSGGLLLETRDPAAVAGAAKLVLEEPWLRREMIGAQRKEIERFERANLARSLEEFLRGCGVEISLGQLPKPARALHWRIEGPFDSSYSLAIVNRELATALSANGLAVGLVSRDGPGPIEPSREFLAANPLIESMWELGSVEHSYVCLRNLYPPLLDNMKGYLRGLGCYGWEESGFPFDYIRDINAVLDFVTVTSRFVAKVLRDNGVHTPITVVGDGVDQMLRGQKRLKPRGAVRDKFHLGNAFCFLHVSSCFPRKGVDVLLKAWIQSFNADDNVVLVIKASPNPHHRIDRDIAAITDANPGHARIVFTDDQLSESEIFALYQRADVMVCPSRGEGFGLPMAEAFAIGKPVITTAFGGQMDFCNSENSWLCDYDFAYARTHLKIPNSIWAEPRLDSLIGCLRAANSSSSDERSRRGELGRCQVIANFRWSCVAERVQQAVAKVQTLEVNALRLPRVGWISTWNSRCGIAAYSQSLASSAFDGRLHVFANRNAEPLGPDETFITRCWEQGWTDSLDELYGQLDAAHVDAVVIQFNFGFFSLEKIGGMIDRLTRQGKAVYVFLHATSDVEKPGLSIHLGDICALLGRVRRLLVHSVHDLNRLKQLGLVDNVTLFPVGLPAAQASASATGLRGEFEAKIATFGYLLPHKGLRELVEAFGLLRRDFPAAHLLMLNASYPAEESMCEQHALEQIIGDLGLQDAVTLKTEYLPESEVIRVLAGVDLVVYPYQSTPESASAAVRLGLASGRPVATTPLAIFDDVADITHRLPGLSPAELALGIGQLLSDQERLSRFAEEQQKWVRFNSWPVLSRRLDGLIRGEFLSDMKAFADAS